MKTALSIATTSQQHLVGNLPILPACMSMNVMISGRLVNVKLSSACHQTFGSHWRWTPGTDSDVISIVIQRSMKTVPVSANSRRITMNLQVHDKRYTGTVHLTMIWSSTQCFQAAQTASGLHQKCQCFPSEDLCSTRQDVEQLQESLI